MGIGRRDLLRTALAASLPSLPVTALAAPARLRLGTATPGGGFPVYGAALVAALRTVDPELVIEARNTKGSTENVPMLERGELDLGLVTGEVLHETWAARAVPLRARGS